MARLRLRDGRSAAAPLSCGAHDRARPRVPHASVNDPHVNRAEVRHEHVSLVQPRPAAIKLFGGGLPLPLTSLSPWSRACARLG